MCTTPMLIDVIFFSPLKCVFKNIKKKKTKKLNEYNVDLEFGGAYNASLAY